MDKQEARDLGLVQLYEWSSPTEMLNTQYGWGTVREWLAHEKNRIERDPSRFAEVVKHNCFLSLFVNPVV